MCLRRAGRAARQGRRGSAFSLVDPEELPYMMDLHLFLGRPVASAPQLDEDGCVSQGYSPLEMTPDMVHYGCFPQQVHGRCKCHITDAGSRGLIFFSSTLHTRLSWQWPAAHGSAL